MDKPGEPSTLPTTIPLYLVNGVATVWDAQTAATLHCVHSISGLRAGTLPGVGQQNAFLGLPVTLMMEEAAWLVRQGIAHLVPCPTPVVPSPALVADRTAARLSAILAQVGAARAEAGAKAAKARAAFAAKGDGALRMREERARRKVEARNARGKGALGVDEVSTEDGDAAVVDAQAGAHGPAEVGEGESGRVGSAPASEDASALKPEPASGPGPVPSAPLSAATTSVFTSIPALPISPPASVTPIASIPHALFPFPQTARDAALLAAFTALHARGYRMGLGPRFGGEYLVYPGDYLRYHAHFTSQVVVDDEPVRPAEIVAWGRLGTGTKKAGLVCCVDTTDERDVEFYSLEWANFG
ncbi:tRNA-splicing endonuclease subunit [Cryptotrichosporon argae]